MDWLAESVYRLEQTLNETITKLDATKIKLSQYTSAIFRASSDYNGHTYLLSTPFLADIHTFTTWCQVQDGHLLEIDDQKEFDHILTFLAQNPSRANPVILGMTNKGHTDTWVTLTSFTNVTFTKWAKGRPSNIATSSCAMLSQFGKTMFDVGCESETLSRFICEVSS